MSSGMFDPPLFLYHKIPVMLNCNIDVHNNMTNGTQALISQIHLNDNETPTYIEISGKHIPAVRAMPSKKFMSTCHYTT